MKYFVLVTLAFFAWGCIEDPSNFSFPIDTGNPNNQNNANNTNNPPNNQNNLNNPTNNLNNPTNNQNNLVDMAVMDMKSTDMATPKDMTPEDQGMDLSQQDLGMDAGGADMAPDMMADLCMVTEGGEEICDGRDNDCDGMIDNADSFLCPMQMGVCAGSTTIFCPMDLDIEPFACGAENYGTEFEEVEARCGDGMDNDCDGLKDCLDPDCDGMACGEQRVCTNNICPQ